MTKVAVMIAPGCEEIEALTPVDVFRRLGIETTMVGLDDRQVMGAHQIALTCDTSLAEVGEGFLGFDCVVFPGGSGGAKALRDDDRLMQLMQRRQQAGEWNAAMCAAPIAFARYGLLDGHDYTCFPGIEQTTTQVAPSGRFHEDITVVDEKGKLITSRGPATALAFAYCIADALGVDAAEVRRQMLYPYLLENNH